MSGLPVENPAAVPIGSIAVPTADPGTGAPNVHVVGGAVTTTPAPPVSPTNYISSTVLTGYTGATWLQGAAFALPSGLKNVSFVITYAGGGPTSELQYRLRVGHSSSAMGVTRTKNSTPTLSGNVATQAEYTSVTELAEVGTTTVYDPVVYENTDGFAYVALDVQEAVADGAGAGTVSVTIAGSYS